MNYNVLVWWYRKLVSFTRIIDRLGAANVPTLALGNEAIRRVVGEMLAHIGETCETQEMEAVEISTFDRSA